ncbi:MAG TPA: MlaD family protein [Baekduia sp.]|nr:MlaD family protein [Baekduia sp.]
MSRRQPTSRRPRRDTEPLASVLLKGLATLGVIAGFVALAVTAQEGVPTKDYTTMYVSARESGSLRGNDKVAIGGVRVGRVARVTPDGQRARIELQLEPGVTLPRDTSVRLRANGLLGARYVQLIPGSSRSPLADGATIRGADDALTATVPDALDVLDAQTRGALGTAVTGLGRGVLGNGGALNDGLRVASRATVPFAALMDRLLADGAPERLVPSLHATADALAASRRDLRAMLDPAARGLAPFADRRAALRATLTEAPSTLAAARAGLDRGAALLAATGGLAEAAHRTLPFAPAGLRQTTALLRGARAGRDGGSPLDRADGLLRTAGPAVPAVLRTTRALRPVLPHLDDALGSTVPMLQHIGRHGCDVINTGVTLRSMTGFVGTGTGPNGPSSQFRLQAAAGVEALGVKEAAQVRDAYYPPCRYLGGRYEVTPLTGIGGGR